MDAIPADISSLVFKGSVKSDLGNYSLDGETLRVLIELDGKKDLLSVSRSLKIDMKMLKKAIVKLIKLRLIERVEKATPMLDDDFFECLKTNLSLSIGPIAEFLLEDELRELGKDPKKIPFHRGVEIVDLLARQIPRQEKRVAFQQAMIEKIKQGMP
ncbi:MAG: hypothetical protein SV775_00810 [Thermodesulfobacteriota bacterium]|nr:hypothetical protein [Thermodesulfobacteriota bacterium]